MKINRAIGLIIALIALKFILSDVFGAFSEATVASFNALQSAAVTSQEQFHNLR